VFKLQYKKIAAFEKITIGEARKRYRYVELNGPDRGNGIQITLYDRSATVTVPLWHGGPAAAAVFEEISEYLRVIRRETGYDVFDGQLEQKIDLSIGIDESLTCYQDCCSGQWPLIAAFLERQKSTLKDEEKEGGYKKEAVTKIGPTDLLAVPSLPHGSCFVTVCRSFDLCAQRTLTAGGLSSAL
jgi:hypothetical protein